MNRGQDNAAANRAPMLGFGSARTFAETWRVLAMSLLIASLFAISILDAHAEKLYPVDEARKDTSFIEFRSNLISAIERGDTATVISILDPNIECSFGGNNGARAFIKGWRLQGAKSKIWPALQNVLALGGAFNADGEFQAPYVFACWPDTYDPFEYGAITAANVNARESASKSAQTLAKLSYDIVRVQDWLPVSADGMKWIRIELTSDQVAYVAQQYIRSAVDYRAGFRKANGKWLMTFMVEGD